MTPRKLVPESPPEAWVTATTKAKSTDHPEERNVTTARQRASRKRKTPPTPEELAEAARELESRLRWIVEQFDKANARGVSDEEAWQEIRVRERRYHRTAATPGLVLAVHAYAQRSIIPRWRWFRAASISYVCLQLVRGEIHVQQALEEASLQRGDDALSDRWIAAELKAKLANARTERAAWQAVYCMLAWDADVWPAPDRARGRSEALARLYRGAQEYLALRDSKSSALSHSACASDAP